MGNQHNCHLLAEKTCYGPEDFCEEIPYEREKPMKPLNKSFLCSFVMMDRGQLFLLK